MPLARANLEAAVESRGGPPTARGSRKRRETDTEWCRPACRALGRRKRTSLSTRCSEARVPPERTSARGALRFGRSQRPPGGPIPGSSQLRAGTHRSARTGEEARHPLLMEWAGAESHLVCTPLLSAPGGEGVEGRTPNHCVSSRATSMSVLSCGERVIMILSSLV